MAIFSKSELTEIFPIFKTKYYFDTASTGIVPRQSLEAMYKFLGKYEGETITDAQSFAVLAMLRENLSELFGAPAENFALVFNTSFGLNACASGIGFEEGDVIAIPPNEFPAKFYPWYEQQKRGVRLNVLPKLHESEFGVRKLRAAVFSWVRFFDGFRFDIARVSDIALRFGALSIVDGIQGAGVLSVNLAKSECDAFCAGGQKWLLSPYGTGFLYLKPDAPISPVFHGWLSRYDPPGKFDSLLEQILPRAKGAKAFELGTLPYHNLWAMAVSTSILLDIGIDNIERHATSLSNAFAREAELLGYRVCSQGDTRRSAIVSIQCDNQDEVAEFLRNANIICAQREGMLRFAFHIYNDESQLAYLLDKLKAAKTIDHTTSHRGRGRPRKTTT